MPRYRLTKPAFMFGQLLEPDAVVFLKDPPRKEDTHLVELKEGDRHYEPPPRSDPPVKPAVSSPPGAKAEKPVPTPATTPPEGMSKLAETPKPAEKK